MAGVVCFTDVHHAASFPRYKVGIMLLAFTVGLNQKDVRGERKLAMDFSKLWISAQFLELGLDHSVSVNHLVSSDTNIKLIFVHTSLCFSHVQVTET